MSVVSGIFTRLMPQLSTVSVAAFEFVVPHELLNAARYLFPFCANVVVKQSGLDVSPGISANVVPPSVLTCHCNVGVGFPVAVEVKHARVPAQLVELAGWSV